MASIAYQVSLTLGDHAEDFDIPAIVEEIGNRYGDDLDSIDAIPSGEYTEIIERHDRAV